MRLGPLLAVVVVLAVALLGGLGDPPRQAQACSLVGFGHQLLPFAIESSTTIAVGRLVHAERDTITLEVEEGLKGTTAGERLTVNNDRLGLGAGCEVYLERNANGFALPEGARVLAFLQANELGGPAKLRSALYGYGIFTLDGEFIRDRRSPIATISNARDSIRRLSGEPTDLNFETVGPCNPSFDLADEAVLRRTVGMSTLIATGTYRSAGGGVAELEVQEVLRGDTGGRKTVKLNAHYVSPSNGCRPVMETGTASYPVRFQALVFLRPDDYGVTDWRGAIWGTGVFAIVGDQLQSAPGLPTLDDVRAAVRAPAATQQPAAKTRDDRWLYAGLVAGAALCTIAAGYVIVRRRRN